MDSIPHEDALVAALTDATRAAGDIALAFFRPGARTSAEVTEKQGGSPVTEADYQVDRFLKERLEALVPAAGWLSEETADSTARLGKRLMLIVDPIDGTRGFAAGNLIWAVAVALVDAGRPIVGIVHAPALAETYVAVHGGGARLNGRPIRVSTRTVVDAGAKLGGPRPLADELRRCGLDFALQPRVGSLAMRIVQVASGVLDVGLAGGNSHDWDIAAADLVLQEAGGVLSGLDGLPPIYNRSDPRHGVLIAAPAPIHPALVAAVRRVKGRPVS